MLSNAYFLAKFRFDTAENEPAKNLQNFRKMHFRKMHSAAPGPALAKRRMSSLEHDGARLTSAPSQARSTRQAAGATGSVGPGNVLAAYELGCGNQNVLSILWQNFARFRLYRHRSLQVNTRFAQLFKTYKII